ncbi:MAG: hypothetical protein ACI9KK_000541 [Ascidiaceihabitans sp.]|jgi:hypothetical protein
MWKWLKSQNQKLNGSRRFAAGALALYFVGWLADRGFTLLWEKVLEKQAPLALRQMSDFLSTDIATGMALMSVFVLFVPPVTSLIFDLSAGLARLIEIRSRRMSRRDYIAEISDEAVSVGQAAKAISAMGRWTYDDPSTIGLNPQEAWKAREELRQKQECERNLALQEFVETKSGRAKFIIGELKSFGYIDEIPREFEHITNFFCVDKLGATLEESAYKAKADLKRDGYPVEPPELLD